MEKVKMKMDLGVWDEGFHSFAHSAKNLSANG